MEELFRHLKTYKAKKLIFFITNSLGELDYLCPFLFQLKNKENLNYKIKLVFINNGVYKQYSESKYFQKIFEILKIKEKKTIFSYDSTDKSHLGKALKIINKIKNIILFLLNIFEFLVLYFTNDFIFIENSTKTPTHILINVLNKFFNKNIILYPHSTLRYTKIPKTHHKGKVKVLNKGVVLITDEKETNFYRSRGFDGQFINTSFLPENKKWIEMLKNNFISPISNNREYVVVFLNGLRDVYFEEKSYTNLLRFTLQAIETVNRDTNIIFKKHPRPYRDHEENKILKLIINEFKHLKIEFDSSPNFILSIFSRYNLIQNNGAIFISHAMNKNSFFLFLEDEGYKSWPEGRSPKDYNLPYISSKNELINKLKAI